MLYYVYFLTNSRNSDVYVGMTSHLDRRLSEHNKGKTRSLKPFLPVKLLGFEQFPTKKEARQRELYLKGSRDAKIRAVAAVKKTAAPSSSG